MLFVLIAWIYDDIQLLKVLDRFSQHLYDDIEFYSERSLIRELGGV